MKKLINVICEQIIAQIKSGKTNIIRLESFDNPQVYSAVCKKLIGKIDFFIAKLAKGKYAEFCEARNPEWEGALIYLQQGANAYYRELPDDAYIENSYVDFNNAITKWRNESANIEEEKTSLILLLGTEAATDVGGLSDTSFVISPKELIASLKMDYSSWFNNILEKNNLSEKETRKAIHTLYRALFTNLNINLFKYSGFIDSITEDYFSTAQELVNYICESLNTVWNIPSIYSSRHIPKVQALSKGKLSAAKIITNSVNFINRVDDIPTERKIETYKKQFEKYAEKNGIDVSTPFPEDNPLYSSFHAFRNCVIDFMRGLNVDDNRKLLLKTDFGLIADILGIRLEGHVVEQKTSPVSGEPVEAFAKIFLDVADRFFVEKKLYPNAFSVTVDRIVLSNCVDDQKEDAFLPIASFLGGILKFFDEASIEYNGELLSFSYDNAYGVDPFDYSNYDIIKDCIRCTGKWGDPCKIQLTINASNVTISKKYEYKWVFSPYCAWPNAFQYLGNVLFRDGSDSYSLPTLVSCDNIQDYLGCESEDEFYAHLVQLRDSVHFEEHRKEIHRYFAGTEVYGLFDVVCNDFKDFGIQLTSHGLFNAMRSLRTVVKGFTALMDNVNGNYSHFTDVQREKVPLLLNSFTITSNKNYIADCNIHEAIVPAYNPVMLEKIDAKQLFIREGFSELMRIKLSDETGSNCDKSLETFSQLSSITQGLDSIYKKPNEYITCQNMWEYFGVYYSGQEDGELLSGNSFGLSIVTDDEDASAMLRSTPMSKILVRNVLDYIRTFPARIDGLNIAFVAPSDMQHIVSAIHTIAKTIEESESSATINLKLICLNSRKNSSTYLRKWLDSYFSEERSVRVNTFLQNYSINRESEVEFLNALLENCDLCFAYDVLSSTGVQFSPSSDVDIDKDQAKFPMTFTPDTIAATHGKSRKVNISQFQFIASKFHTQANHTSGYPDSMPGVYRTFKTLELRPIHERIIEIAHNCCKWVVCIDPAIDRNMLEKNDNKIIGFTTGEGSYGELNVTVSARKDVLTDIKVMLQKRITEKFRNWDDERLQKAAVFCVDELSKYMDGSRILKALNPYDYEIHNYLAYILTLQMLQLSKQDNSYAVRSLISLDSYKHWFEDEKDNIRPDFMLIEIPISKENLDVNAPLTIDIKIIECKMGYKSDSQISKAKKQLEKGLRIMTSKWRANAINVMHRYWMNQLYRAIIFSPLNLSNTSVEYTIIRNKIFNILAGKVEFNWSGDIFAFWLDSNTELPDEYNIESDEIEELKSKGISVSDIKCHSCGQMFIQKMLLPPEERDDDFIFNADINAEDSEDIELPDNEEQIETPMRENELSLPQQGDVLIPFLKYLDSVDETNRQASLTWFSECFHITAAQKTAVYESNMHPKWETILDSVITKFRQDELLENSSVGSFHITALGSKVCALSEHLSGKSLTELIEEAKLLLASQPGESESSNITSQNQDRMEMNNNDEHIGRLSHKELKDVRLLLGKDLRTQEPYFWEFGNKELNNRHLLINGNSGCGKTYCIQTLLMEAALQGISSIVFDYTGGFANSKLDPIFKETLGDRIEQRIVKTKKIPVRPFVKHDIQIDDDIFVPEENADVADKIAEIFKSVYSLGDQQRSAIYSAVMSGLKTHGDNMSFPVMVEELENLGTNYAKSVIHKIQTFTDFNPFTTDEDFKWSDIRDSEGTVYVFQLIGYGREIQVLLTELLLWDIWSFCVKNGDESKPFVLVLDEAQNLSHGEKSPSAKILTEGRKFGLSGWYATQFMKPQLSDDEIQRLQQAGQKLYFCPPDDGILTVAKNIDITSQGTKDWSEKLKKLKKGECVTCGSMVKNGRWGKYEPRMIKVTSLQERLNDD